MSEQSEGEEGGAVGGKEEREEMERGQNEGEIREREERGREEMESAEREGEKKESVEREKEPEVTQDTALSTSTVATSQVTSSSHHHSTTVTITAGGITATVTTTDSDSDSTPSLKTSSHITTAPATIPRCSSITFPKLTDGVFPLSGVTARSEKLVQLRTTSLDNYLQDDEETRIHAMTPLQIVTEGGTGLIFNRPTPENVVRKCVYMYEDKYSFCRVLQPGMLLFDSHFECGNLNAAYLVTSNRDSDRATGSQQHSFYDLYMNEDVSSTAGAQWFYFSVSGNKAKQKITFSIRNFYKPESLFNEGMRPLVLSLKGTTNKSGEKRKGWTRTGFNISYRQETAEECNFNPAPASTQGGKRSSKKSSSNRSPKSILTFTHVFGESQDTCFFAFSHPYSYSDLQSYLFFAEGKLEQSVVNAALTPRVVSPRYSKVSASQECSIANVSQTDPTLLFYYRTKLCNTLGGNRCDLLVISSLDNVQLKNGDPEIGTSVSDAKEAPNPFIAPEKKMSKPNPPLSRASSASKRPSPSPSSRSVKDSELEYYPIPGLALPVAVPHIIISARVHPGETTASWIPMLNPDGVINGNNRTSLSGHDLNRNWRCPDPNRHPTIHNLKELSKKLVEKTSHDVLMYMDLHGHSRQKGAFTYGCLPDRNDIQQIRDFFSAAPTTLPNRNDSVSQNKVQTVTPQNSSKNLKNESGPTVRDDKRILTDEGIVSDKKIQQQVNEIQSNPLVGTRGILSTGRRRSEDSTLDVFLKLDMLTDVDGDENQKELHHSPRRGSLCGAENETVEGEINTTTKSYAPMLLRPSSPITKQNSTVGLQDAQSSMNIDVNFDGYANNKTAYVYSNRGASLETDSDRNIVHSFSYGDELERKFGTKEERVKSLPRIFLKRMTSFNQGNCSYKVPSSKLSTSRAVMALEIGIECSYTLEISLAGDNKKLFQPTDLLNIGKAMGKSLHDWMHSALSYLETKKLLEEQERIRQEQLDAYFNYNNKNVEREKNVTSGSGNRPRSRTRPQSGGATRRKPQSSSSQTFIKEFPAPQLIKDLDMMLYGAPVKTKSAHPTIGADSQALIDKPSRNISDKKNSNKQLAGNIRDKNSGKEKPRGKQSSYENSKVLTPSLQVKHVAPEYIIDGTEKCDILSAPVQAVAPTVPTKKMVSKEVVPKLNLSITHTSYVNNDNPDSGGAKINPRSSRLDETPTEDKEIDANRSLPSGRRVESDELGWEAQVVQNTTEVSPNKSPRASALRDCLQYSQNSKSESPSSPRTVYHQPPQSLNHRKFRSESAKARKSPNMANKTYKEDISVTVVQQPISQMHIKSKSRGGDNIASVRSKINKPDSYISKRRQDLQERMALNARNVSDNDFTASAKEIVAEHKSTSRGLGDSSSPKKNKKTKKYVLAEQLQMLRREYEESTRHLDVDENQHDDDLNLHSNDPKEEFEESAFSNYTTFTNARTGNRGIASKRNLYVKQRLNSKGKGGEQARHLS